MRKVWLTVLGGLLSVVFCLSVTAQTPVLSDGAGDALIKSQVETAVSLLAAIHARQQKGEMSAEKAKELAAGLLRELRYGKEGYFWADTTEGVNVVLYGRKDTEGRNRLADKDAKGVFYVKEFLARGKTGGYVEYLFTKKGQTATLPKRAYVLLFKPFGWVVGT
ncbi:MAG: cache domain-containing protein [Syntrophaceae bacterium]|nr:cache domain-containing protein [Syntrophaceae bacterium]